MARKKSSAIVARSQEEDVGIKPQSKSPRDLSPDHKLDNLKTLNQLLLKETMEKRFEIDHLKAQIEEISESQPFVSDLEREVSRIVFAEKFELLNEEKEGMKNELGIVISERGLLKKEVGDLEVKVRGLERGNFEMREKLGRMVVERDETEIMRREKEEAFESLKKSMEDAEKEKERMSERYEKVIILLRDEIEANLGKIERLEEEGNEFVKNTHLLEGQVRASKDEVRLLKKEEEGLKAKVVELEERNKKALEEIGRLQTGVVILEKEKEEKEKEFESKIREVSSKMEEISTEKDEAERAKDEQKVMITKLRKEADKLGLQVVEFEKMFVRSQAQWLDEKDAIKKEFAAFEKETKEESKGFNVKFRELMIKFEDLSSNMREISVEKDEIENVKAKQDVVIVELKKEVQKLSSNISELKDRCRDYGMRSSQLQDERDKARNELGDQREESRKLLLQVQELKKSKDEYVEELEQLNASLHRLGSEKDDGKRRIKSLTEENASLEKSLRAAEMISDRTLYFFTSIAEDEFEKIQDNGVSNDDDKFRPFADELERINSAFKSKVVKIKEMNKELEIMQKEMADVKKKSGLMKWLYPATTAVIAGIAYAANGH